MGMRLRDLKGQTFGKWTVLEQAEHCPKTGKTRWVCRCTCGEERAVLSTNLVSGMSKGCRGCSDRSAAGRPNLALRKEMEGLVFGKWTVLRFDRSGDGEAAYWWCRCTCGNERSVNGSSLRRGKSTQCRPCAGRSVRARAANKERVS